ncbi:MAG TPA: arginine deiminase family protein [Thermoanaerobaculia bacterium]|nr:arginine deiminase family protein [Thermoanaerobaculia bacterium]
MTAVRVHSEIGRLRRVMLHRPGPEIDRMVPSMMERLLFDDILYGDEAREEHDLFRAVFERAGVEVVEAGELLAGALASEEARSGLLRELEGEYEVPQAVVERLAALAPPELAGALIAGLRAPERTAGRAGQAPPFGRFFDLDPVPNYFFQRDPQAAFGERVMIASMATEAREREPLLAKTIFAHHPEFAGRVPLFEVERSHLPPRGGWPEPRSYPYPDLEGGDLLVASRETLLVGLSERTNRRGVEALAGYLRGEETSFRNLIVVELPARRACMHLDTVFTLIDHETCLAYLPVIHAGGAESAHAYAVDLTARELTFTVRPSLLDALRELGVRLEAVPCGGAGDPIEQQREQWTDGANAFAIAPGVILSYQRNRRTVEELDRRGWRVVSEVDVAEGRAEVFGAGRTVVTIAGNELSRARGGPRCMTAPLVRDELEGA